MIFRTLVAATCFAASLSGANAATITNGSFEGLGTPGFVTENAPSLAITGWTIGGHSVDWINDYWEPQDGSNSVDLNGNGQGSIFQTISDLIVNTTYKVTFYLGGNSDGAPTIKNVGVDVGLGQQAFTFDTTGTDIPSPMNWAEYSYVFTATSTSQVLTFASLDSGSFGAALDNVSISTIPIPASLPLLLAGLGGLAMIRRRRKG